MGGTFGPRGASYSTPIIHLSVHFGTDTSDNLVRQLISFKVTLTRCKYSLNGTQSVQYNAC